MCCLRGKIRLPVLKEPPAYLHGLLTNDEGLSRHFRDNIHAINMMFLFTSLGGKIDNLINRGKSPKFFKLHGENYHLIGSVKPNPNEPAKLCQLYIHDTANEVQNMIAALSGNSDNNKIRAELVESIMEMQRGTNVHVKTFRNAIDRFNSESECEDVKLESKKKKKTTISMREFFSYRIQIRRVGSQVLLFSRRLLQQFLVDAYTMIESHRLRYIRKNQGNLRSLKYNLFITFTCNPKWSELTRYFQKYNLRAKYRPDLCCRLFKVKLDSVIDDLTKKHLLGRTVSVSKRGLPHAHILLFMESKDKFPTSKDIYRIISAEIPDKEMEPRLYDIVKDTMIHGPCGVVNKDSSCMNDGRCTIFFPRKNKKGIQLDNGYVVPYNKTLMLCYNAHINIEWCNQSRSIKYLFKYINEGSDCVTTTITQKTTKNSTTTEGNQNSVSPDFSSHTAGEGVGGNTPVEGIHTVTSGEGKEPLVDEIKKYFDAIYMSACESTWMIFSFPIHYRATPVEKLTFHLEGDQPVNYKEGDTVESVMARVNGSKKMFLAWFDCCEKYPKSRLLTYAEMPTRFIYDPKEKVWNKRKRTVDGVFQPSFEEACYKFGLLDDDKEYIGGLKECSFWSSGPYVRNLFAQMLLNESLSSPKLVWEETKDSLSEDILYLERQKRRNLTSFRKPIYYYLIYGIYVGLILNEEQLLNCTLLLIDKILRSYLGKLETLPQPTDNDQSNTYNQLLQDEMNDHVDELRVRHQEWFAQLTHEHKGVYDEITRAVNNLSGKMFLWNILSAAVRSRGDVVLNVASSGIAALLLPGGRTAHSRFGIPINPDEFSTCKIQHGSHQAELISKASLIICDESPMMSKHCFESLDRSLRDIMKTTNERPFGGKVIVFGGGFRQILPVIPKENRVDIVMAALNSSYLWKHCKVLQLNKNMRLFSEPDCREAEEIKDDPIKSIVSEVYGSTFKDSSDPIFFQERAILSPTNEDVDVVNNFMLDHLKAITNIYSRIFYCSYSEEQIYLNSDSIDPADTNSRDDSVFTPEFVNSIKNSCLPNHSLRLRIGTHMMLLRNIDPNEGLCNETRMQIIQLANHILQAKVITETKVGEKVWLHRLLLSPTYSKLPFKMRRRQFPLKVFFAMTINKSQDQTLAKVGLFLPRPVFSYGQLYDAVSRVKSRKGIKDSYH
ncbi:hypothetical protein N665_0446s0010 [Sinapis alba]|nr:hypothetical protein N665_0446s0010 [Sinapis alba]